ncbi:MAG TPA: hypothetical protein VF995_00505 [Actinomycetota bacterium]
MLRIIRRAAIESGIDFTLKRQGRAHEVWLCGQTLLVVPRHRNLNQLTAQSIRKKLESEFAKDWWK